MRMREVTSIIFRHYIPIIFTKCPHIPQREREAAQDVPAFMPCRDCSSDFIYLLPYLYGYLGPGPDQNDNDIDLKFHAYQEISKNIFFCFEKIILKASWANFKKITIPVVSVYLFDCLFPSTIIYKYLLTNTTNNYCLEYISWYQSY